MNPLDDNSLLNRLERIAQRMEHQRLDEYLRYVHNWRKRLWFELLGGLMRGLGFSIGFSILGALLLFLLRNAALSNLPVIGRFLAELVRVVESNLS